MYILVTTRLPVGKSNLLALKGEELNEICSLLLLNVLSSISITNLYTRINQYALR